MNFLNKPRQGGVFPVLRRIYVVMRLTALALVAFSLNISATVYSQKTKLSLDVTNQSIKEILFQIENQSEFRFIYESGKLNLDKKVSINEESQTVETILNRLFAKEGIEYEITENNLILINPVEKTARPDLQSAQQQKTQVTGTVTDANGEPIVGANVLVKGQTGMGTTTDMDGKFSLDLKGIESPILVISYIGYTTQEVVVGDKTVLNITMREDSKALEEVVVIGYGANSKRNLTSAVSTVDAGKIKNVPVANITDALAGRAAGLIVTQSGGGIGKKSTVSIRGGGQPIVVIDGFIAPYDDFVNLNSDDIESMSILKDAAAAAVYGARAGDGVLVIKTKGGLRGLHVDYSFNQSWSEPTYLEKKLNSYERATFDNAVREMYNLEPRWTQEEVEKYRTGSDPYNYPNEDWQKLVLKNFAPESKHSLAVRGGSDFNKFYVSFQAYDQNSLYRADTEWLKRYNVRMNETSEFKNLGLTLNFGLDGYITNQHSPRSQYSNGYWQTWGHIQNHTPMELAYNKDGQIYIGYDNPLAEISPESGYSKSDVKMITGIFNAEWKVLGVEGLKLKFGKKQHHNMIWKGIKVLIILLV